MGFIERLIPWARSPESSERAFAKRVEQTGLPRCSREVVIACPEYQDEHFHCEIRVATPILYQWAEQHVDMTRLSHCPPRNAREWLAVWLGQADLRDDRPSKIAADMYPVLRDYIPDFVIRGQARLYCYLCEAWTSHVNEEEFDRGMDGALHVWTSRWSCPRGHRLYQERHHMHLQYRRD